MTGDIVEENLGLSPADLDRLCKEVSVVIHTAASVRFDEPLQKAIESNVEGLQNLLKLGTQMNTLYSSGRMSLNGISTDCCSSYNYVSNYENPAGVCPYLDCLLELQQQ